MKIGLLHHIGGGNLGDDATQQAVLQNIVRRWPRAEVFGFSANPRDTLTRHGIPSYPIRRRTWRLGYQPEPEGRRGKARVKTSLRRHPGLFRVLRALNAVAARGPRTVIEEIRFLVRSYRIIRSFDLLIVNGGGQLTEWGGPWEFTYTIFKWARLARLAGVRRVFLNVGAGPLTRPLSRFFVRQALSCAAYVSFRDEQSRALVRQIGYAGETHVFPDSAYSLDIRPCARVSRQQRRLPVVGVAPMPYCDPRIFPEKDQQVYDRYIRELGAFVDWLACRGYAVSLFGSDIGTDPLAIEDLRAVLRADCDETGRLVSIERADSSDDLLTKMGAMDYVVTSRFHGVVFAHLVNKPVVALSHHPKVETLMKDIGLERYCLDIRAFELDSLTEAFSALVNDRVDVEARMAQTLARFRQTLDAQFDQLFPEGTL